MSASEKLRELMEEAVWESGQGGGHAATEAIEDALPLIADVVEAAEVVGQWPPENRYDYPPLRTALIALRKHLEEK